MKKEGVLFSVFLIILLSFSVVLAQNQTMEERAYSCLESRVSGKCSTLSPEDQIFALLASGYSSSISGECKTALGTSSCYPVGKCTIKDTALASLALAQTGSPIESMMMWFSTKEISPPNLVFYLQIDTPGNTTCKVTYNFADYNVNVKDDKTLTIVPNICLKVKSPNNQWLEIDKSCLGYTFDVSCNDDFVSSTLYKSSTSNTVFVSGSLESSSAQGTTSHIPSSKCLSEGGATCDYPGTLWAAYALMRAQREEYKSYLPYLFAFADDNKKAVPYAFLYAFTAEDEYRQKLLIEQKEGSYWDFGSAKGRFYDTATALIGFQTETNVLSAAKFWLSEKQNNDGCWQNSVRDTAFLLWAISPKTTILQATQQDCEDSGYSCMTEGECMSTGGSALTSYKCTGLKICCSKALPVKTCSEMSGTPCGLDESCSSTAVMASDTSSCCLGMCLPSTLTQCEQFSYYCKTYCDPDFEEEVTEYSCNTGDICCKAKEAKTSIWVWIILFVVLAGLTTLGIIYREKVKLWYYKIRFKLKPLIEKIKSKFRRGPSAAPAAQKPRYPPAYPPRQAPPARGVASDIEETLKKLREIGK